MEKRMEQNKIKYKRRIEWKKQNITGQKKEKNRIK